MKRKREADIGEEKQEIGEAKWPRKEVSSLRDLVISNGIPKFFEMVLEKGLCQEVEGEWQTTQDYETLKKYPDFVKEIVSDYINKPLDKCQRTRLHKANTMSQVLTLLLLNAKQSAVTSSNENVLMYAIRKGRTEIALLFTKGLSNNILFSSGNMMYGSFIYDNDNKYSQNWKASRVYPGGTTYLHEAAIMNDVLVAEALLDNFNGNKDDILTMPAGTNQLLPIHLAAQYSPDILKLLVEKYNASLKVKDRLGRTPFLIAAAYKTPALLEWLLNKDKDLLADKDKKNCTSLSYALHGWVGSECLPCMSNYLNIQTASYLIEKGAPFTPNDIYYVFFEDRKSEDFCTLSKLLLQKNGNQFIDNYHILFDAASFGDLGLVQTLVSYRANVNQYSLNASDFNYPLACAIFPDYSVFEKFKAGDYEGSRELYTEIRYSIIEYLIAHGAKITQEHRELINKSSDERLKQLVERAQDLEIPSELQEK